MKLKAVLKAPETWLILTTNFLILFSGSQAKAESGAEKLDRALKTTDFIRDSAHDEFADPRKIKFALPKGKVNQREVNDIVRLLKAPLPVQSSKKVDLWASLRARHDTTITGLRGGAPTDMPLGCYAGLFRIEYQSKYKDVSNENVAFWAYDLHRFLSQNKSWYGKFSDSVYMHYADKERFARNWWTALDKTFAALSPAEQSAWIHDALEDGIVVYWFYDTSYEAVVLPRQKNWLGWEIRGIEKRD